MPVARSNIASISVQNFKFFNQRETFQLNGDHLLLYGENGSGKSSLYWALYTLLECANKDDANEIKKYFDPADEDKLTNLFLLPANPDWIDSEIKMLLQDGTDINVSFANTAINGNADAKAANYATEFLNYKMLFRLHNFAHSDYINIFEYFEREVLPYVKFSPVKYWTKNDDGTPNVEKTTENAKEIWDFVKKGPPKTGKMPDGIRPRYPKRVEAEFDTYKNIVEGFKNELEQLLTFINTQGNPILQTDFQYDFTFKLELEESKPLRLSDLQFDYPQFAVKLTVTLFHGKPGVLKPHTFLNEARLSALGLALRFALLQKRLQDSKLKMTILDDFMISLDMKNRDVAMDYILDKVAPHYQLLILTHDRFLYELASDKIIRKGQANWKRYQMFEDEDTPPTKIFPLVVEDKGLLNKARALYKRREYALSANQLRVAAEKFCSKYLDPPEKIGGDYKPLNLNGMMGRTIAKATTTGINAGLLADLQNYRQRIMNPGSHYDIESPLFPNELIKAIETMEAL